MGAILQGSVIWPGTIPAGKNVIAVRNAIVASSTNINAIYAKTGGATPFDLADVANSVVAEPNPIPFSVDPTKLKNGISISITRWVIANRGTDSSGHASGTVSRIQPITQAKDGYIGGYPAKPNFKIATSDFGKEITIYDQTTSTVRLAFYVTVTNAGFKFRTMRATTSSNWLMEDDNMNAALPIIDSITAY